MSIEVDIKGLQSKINQLQTNDLYKIERAALRKSARILYDNTKINLLSSVPKPTQPNPKYTDTLADAVRMAVHQDNTNNFYFVVHIMGTRKSGSGTFRTKFFEGGTSPRITKSPYKDRLGRSYPAGLNRGSLKPTNFFASAISGSEQTVINAIQKNFMIEFNKIWNS